MKTKTLAAFTLSLLLLTLPALAQKGAPETSTAPGAPEQGAPPGPTLVEIAMLVNTSGAYAGEFDTLLAAATCTGFEGAIVSFLSSNGQKTLFAPIDSAFAALGLDDQNVCDYSPLSELGDILTYHVAPGRRDAVDVLDSDQIRTYLKSFVYQSGGMLIDNNSTSTDAGFVVTDVWAANGLIHAIDQVLLPY